MSAGRTGGVRFDGSRFRHDVVIGLRWLLLYNRGVGTDDVEAFASREPMLAVGTNDAMPTAAGRAKPIAPSARPSSEPARRRPPPLRAACEVAVGAVLALLLVRSWLIEPFTIDSNSMAEGLPGPHVSIACPDCAFQFAAGIEGPESDGRPAICPNCGCANTRLSIAAVEGGDAVLVDKAAFCARAPRRWEIVALRAPHAASEIWVKRIVGLPGEEISILDGDVYIDGRIARKNLPQQRALSVPVNDDRVRPKLPAALCWQFGDGSNWRRGPVGFTYSADPHGPITLPDRPIGGEPAKIAEASLGPAAPSSADEACQALLREPSDWLTYHHIRRNGSSEHVGEGFVSDVQGYNQTFAIRDVHPVRDLTLSFWIVAEGSGRLYLRAGDGARDFVCSIAADGRADLWIDDCQVARGASETPLAGKRHFVELSLVDRACLVAIDGDTLIEYSFDRPPPGACTSTPFALSVEGLALDVSELRIWRDVYYGVPNNPAAASELPFRLAENEFFVLADNSSLGLDSRYAAFGPAVPAKLFVGKPFVACGSTDCRASDCLRFKFRTFSKSAIFGDLWRIGW
jgi:signal peptidase I